MLFQESRCAQHEIALVPRRMVREGTGDRERQLIGGRDGEPVADIGKDRDRIELVITVGAAAKHMQREIDLCGGAPFERAPAKPSQILPGILSCMPG